MSSRAVAFFILVLILSAGSRGYGIGGETNQPPSDSDLLGPAESSGVDAPEETIVPLRGEEVGASGTITFLDEDTGRFMLETEEGVGLSFHADPDLLAQEGVEAGAQVLVKYEMRGTLRHVFDLRLLDL